MSLSMMHPDTVDYKGCSLLTAAGPYRTYTCFPIIPAFSSVGRQGTCVYLIFLSQDNTLVWASQSLQSPVAGGADSKGAEGECQPCEGVDRGGRGSGKIKLKESEI